MKKEKKSSRRKLIAGAAAAAVLVVILAVMAVQLYKGRDETGDIAFYVDGEPVYEEEVSFAVAKERLTVRNHIMNEYDVASDDFSWDQEYGGMTALEHLEEAVLEDCKQNKVIQIVAREQGVADEIDYPSVKSMNEEDTAVREERIESGEVIYGNTSYKASDYYDYVISNLEQQAYYQMVEKGLIEVTEDETAEIYEENKAAIEEAGLGESTAETIGLQQKFADYIRQRTDEAVIENIDKGVVAEIMEQAK